MLDERQIASVQWSAGAMLPKVTFPPLTRTTLALYAGGSGDHNPLHVDIDFARSIAGMDDVIGHGMLTMALAGRYVSTFGDPRSLRTYSLRFIGMSRVGDQITCSGRIGCIVEQDDARYAEVELQVTRGGGELLASGSAVFAIQRR
jgi:acyl dehydratase